MRGGYRVEANMEMHEIKYFRAACRTLNFHRAAELNHVSQPALARAVHPRVGVAGARHDGGLPSSMVTDR
jgi:Bacterial regulatory helix-turn-helix protein, lysR family